MRLTYYAGVSKIMPPQQLSIQTRLELYALKRADCTAALRAERIPLALGLEVTQACVVRGIRYNYGFAQELQGTLPLFTRALNARAIMSNIIPEINSEEEYPYCIWHPDIATEATYQQLISKYPGMRYQVGRACAVAGYVNLYFSLNLLPDVSIAEEALASQFNPNSKLIFDDIISRPLKYAVMNDYTRLLNLVNPPPGAQLNDDTAVRSVLDEKHVFEGQDGYATVRERDYKPFLQRRPYFNIAEDFGVTDDGIVQENPLEDQKVAKMALDMRTRLLYSPLPIDLPNINKDLLILRAAYSGNIERYVRLRRPQMIDGELSCILRGIYHDTMFAKWWLSQSKSQDKSELRLGSSDDGYIRRAINARCIMNNDLSRIRDDTPDFDLPYLIYYPNLALKETYQELLVRKPQMREQIARAYMIMDEQDLWDATNPKPSPFLYWEANLCPNRYYVEDLERRDPSIGSRNVSDYESGKCIPMLEILQNNNRWPLKHMVDEPASFDNVQMGGIYDNLRADFENLERFICSFEETA